MSVVNQDIMKTDIKELIKDWTGPLKVISNLPYYITTPIIMMLLETDIAWDTLRLWCKGSCTQACRHSFYKELQCHIISRAIILIPSWHLQSPELFYSKPDVDWQW